MQISFILDEVLASAVVTYCVYIISNKRHTVLYTGVTSDLEQRMFEHKTKYYKGFSARYGCDQLMYFEEFAEIEDAIRREKQLKRYRRAWKEDLINKSNPKWKDLSEGWFDDRNIELGLSLNKRPSPGFR